jgi:hypothetical protein
LPTTAFFSLRNSSSGGTFVATNLPKSTFPYESLFIWARNFASNLVMSIGGLDSAVIKGF